MEEMRRRLELELNHAMERIHQLGGAIVIEEFRAPSMTMRCWRMKEM